MSNPTPQDARIRALMVELAESAPLAPTAEELGLSTQPVTLDDTQTLPSYTEVSSMVVKEPKRRRLFGGLAAAATMLLGGSVAYNVANNDGPGRPEAAVEQLLDAMADEDALGILDSIDPDERTVLAPEVASMVAELERVEVLGGVDTGDVSGFDFAHEDVELIARQLTADLWAVRMVDGRFSSSTDPRALPLGASAQTGQEDGFATDLDEWIASWPELFAEEDFEILVTDGDEGWRVNVLHTFLEAVRKAEGWPTPDYSTVIDPTGAESPEAAVRQWMTAQGAWDVSAIINLVDPVEVPAVHLYESQLAEVFNSIVDDFPSTNLYTFDDPRLDEDGGRLTAVIETFSIERVPTESAFGNQPSFNFDGNCRRNDVGLAVAASSDSCVDGDDRAMASVAAATPIEIRLVERDGRWFVSPMGTVIDHAFDALRVREAQDMNVEAVFATLFELPVFPIWSPGMADGFLTFDEAQFEAVSEGVNECAQPPLQELPTESEAAARAEALATCLVEAGIALDGGLSGPDNFASDQVAATACAYLWSPDLGVELTLEETNALLPDYRDCTRRNGSFGSQEFMLIADYCGRVIDSQLDDPSDGAIVDDAFAEAFNDCFSQFDIPSPVEVEVVDEEE